MRTLPTTIYADVVGCPQNSQFALIANGQNVTAPVLQEMGEHTPGAVFLPCPVQAMTIAVGWNAGARSVDDCIAIMRRKLRAANQIRSEV
ncbi:MAG: hypothetical protein AAFR17_12370 [Pseudomonadota bacterium]